MREERLSKERLAEIRERAKIDELRGNVSDRVLLFAEVERLTAENETMFQDLCRARKFGDDTAHLMSAAIETREKVKDAPRKQISHTLRARKQRDVLTAEVKRLGTELDKALDDCDFWAGKAGKLVGERCGMTAENARLRAELEAITKQINRVRSCKMCVRHKSDVLEEPCATCNMIVKQNFEWARPCPADTPAQGATDETRGGGEG